ILRDAAETLETAEVGLSDLLDRANPPRRLPGLRNLTVFGRAVTNVLQNLRTPAGVAFDDWYAPIQTQMANDELLRYFYRLRSVVLKEGSVPPIGSSMYIEHLDMREFQPLMAHPPRGARSFFMGDQLGGGRQVTIAALTPLKAVG